jgi:hypothetical protein
VIHCHNKRTNSLISIVLCLFIILIFNSITSDTHAYDTWKKLATGLELGTFETQFNKTPIDSTITILRIDPKLWDFKLMSLSETKEKGDLSVWEWCKKYKLTAGINAGMFAEDYSTHIGYMKSANHVNSSKVTSYKSVAAFSPKVKNIPSFRIFDLEDKSITEIKKQYSCVVQNLRLIKRPGVNKWSQQNKKWSEVALGEDKSGNVLFIFCRYPYSMYDFNRILLKLPINLVAAQHLEGGPEAQLYVNAGGIEINKNGSYETSFNENDSIDSNMPVPNIIGIVKR